MTLTPEDLATEQATRMGDIGEGQREYEFEPLTAPSVPEPIVAPLPAPEPKREPVPA